MLDPGCGGDRAKNLGFWTAPVKHRLPTRGVLARFFAVNDHHHDALLHLSTVTIAAVIARTERKDAA